VVVHGETGYLVPIEQADDGTGRPLDPDRFVRDLSAALVRAVSDPDEARAMGLAGRSRAVEEFGWASIAERTAELYEKVVGELRR
jgi:starch synthase